MDRRVKRRRLNPKEASESDGELIESASEVSAEENEEYEGTSSEEESNDESAEGIEDDSDEPSDNEEDDIIQDELADIDFGTLAKTQRSLLQGTATPAIIKSTKRRPSQSKVGPQRTSISTEKPKSKSKNAPQEITSKHPVSRRHFLPSVQNHHQPRDPRFETLTNTVSEQSFRNAYNFLDDYQRDEIALLKTQIRQSRDVSETAKLEKTLQSLLSRRDARIAKDRANAVLKKKKDEEMEKVKHGKQPFYLKKSDQRKIVMEEKYRKLGKKRLEKVLEKKRKKKEGKEMKRIPRQRARDQ